MAGFHRRLLQKAAGDSHTSGPGSQNTKDVPVLRVDHIAIEIILPGVWEVPCRSKDGAARCKVNTRRLGDPSLITLENGTNAAIRNCLDDPQSRLAGVFRAGNLGRRQPSGEMSLVRRMPRGKRALLFRFGSAHRATHGQYLLQREFLGIHFTSIQHRQFKKRSVLLF